MHHYWVFGRGAAHAALRGPLENSGHSLFGLRPKLSGRMIVTQYERLLYQRFRILCAAFDTGIRTMSLHCASPVGWHPRSCRKYLPVSRLCLSFRPRCSTPGQLHRILRELMVHHRYSRLCRCDSRDSPTRTLYHLGYGYYALSFISGVACIHSLC